MARPRKEIDEELLLQLYMSGMTSRDLAKKFKICQQTVLNRLYKYIDITVDVKVHKVLKSS